jgi:hypothetical protein
MTRGEERETRRHKKLNRGKYLVWLMDLAMVWDGKTIILVQDYGFDVRLPVVPSKCLVERDG